MEIRRNIYGDREKKQFDVWYNMTKWWWWEREREREWEKKE